MDIWRQYAHIVFQENVAVCLQKFRSENDTQAKCNLRIVRYLFAFRYVSIANWYFVDKMTRRPEACRQQNPPPPSPLTFVFGTLQTGVGVGA
jgi:hypothetical protein